MNFEINRQNFRIEEVSQKEIKDILEDKNDKIEPTGKYFGITCFDDNMIYLDKDVVGDRKRSTLAHELTHCYIANCMSHQDKIYTEEEVCDLVANCHDFVNTVVNEYFN